MRTTLKLVVPLAISVVLVSLLYAGYQVRTERRNLRTDLIHRSAALADSLQNSLEPFSGTKTDKNLQHITEHFTQREHLLGVAVYDATGNVLARSSAVPDDFKVRPPLALRATRENADTYEFQNVSGLPLFIYA